MLADFQIKEIFKEHPLIELFNTDHLNGASYDVTLGEDIDVFPDQFLLTFTEEIINLPDDIAAQVHGRSSVGRAGIQVQNAGFIDPGFSGQITLEVKNQGRHARKYPKGFKIAQITFYQLAGPVDTPYHKQKVCHYQGQMGATPSRDIPKS